MIRRSSVNIRSWGSSKSVRIGSEHKPLIDHETVNRWQSLIDTAAALVKIPAGLIMKLNEDSIEVFVKSNSVGNPYHKGEKSPLVYGLYCETVIGTQSKLLIPDARKDRLWNINNPDIDIDMVSYLGVPVNWPDGEVFGTVCFLDNKENHYSKEYEDFIFQVKQHIENDLKLLVLNTKLTSRNIELEQLNLTKTRFLSLISHDIRGSIGTINEAIKVILSDFARFDKTSLKLLLESLGRNASSSYHTLEDLLSWSKNDFLQIETQIETIDVVELVEKVLEFFDQSLLLKSIKVEKFFSSPEVFIETDKKMLTVVVRNIISNAIKFNDHQGTVVVAVTKGKGVCEIMVADSGRGMTDEYVKKLFEYSDNQKSGTLNSPGAGLGLILTKEFIDKLGGKIEFASTPGKGTEVKILL